MTTPTFPDKFLAANPRYREPALYAEVAQDTYAVTNIETLNIVYPQMTKKSGYASLIETIVAIPPGSLEDPLPTDEPTEVVVSGTKQLGGVELTSDEMDGLPGAPEFFLALNDLILQKYQAIKAKTP